MDLMSVFSQFEDFYDFKFGKRPESRIGRSTTKEERQIALAVDFCGWW
jgi:hypothetical protein